MFETIEQMTKAFGTTNERLININDAEEKFENIATRFLNNETISSSELEFYNKYLGKFYPTCIGGQLYPYPKYEKKLKPIYEQIANYYTKNLKRNTPETVTFLQYFYLTQMSKENNITPIITVGDDYFKEHPNTHAFHYSEHIKGINRIVPHVCYNPEVFEQVAKDYTRIPELICTGFHELEHEVQEIQARSKKINNPQSLIWAKEYIARRVLGDNYYRLNYNNIFHERDAFDYSTKRVKDLFAKQGISISININSEYNVDVKHKENTESEEVLAVDLLDVIVSRYVLENPKILNQYSVLKNIYNDNGEKKTLSQIQSELDDSQKELIPEICKTDNDLQFQYLCQTAANQYSLNETDNFNKTVNSIKSLLKKRELSYDEYTKKLGKRISELKNKINQILHANYSHEEYKKCRAELDATKILLNAILEYNPVFKEKHNEVIMKQNIKVELSRKLKHNVVDEYKGYLTDKGYIILESKSQAELYEDYRNNMKQLIDTATSREELEKDIKDLNTVYSDYIDLDNMNQYKQTEGTSR